jgi:UTP--glucose-1-phosphate uridylyltransferase
MESGAMTTAGPIRVRRAVIPAAGLGTRFLPATKAVPKELLPLADRPALQWLVEEALAAGAEQVCIVTSPDKPALREHFRPRPEWAQRLRDAGRDAAAAALAHLDRISARVCFVEQPEPRGLGDAILCAAPCVGDEPFLVLLGDALVRAATPCAAQLAARHAALGGAALVGLERVPPERASRYGIVAGRAEGERLWRLTELVEKPAPGTAPSDLAIAGRYLLTPRVFAALRRARPGHGGEIQLTDAIRACLAEEPVYGYRYEGVRFDIGDPRGYLAAAAAFADVSP